MFPLKASKFIFLFILFSIAGADFFAQDGGATIAENFTDEKGIRQGFWRITGAISDEADYKKSQVVEEGIYEDNKRQGTWKKYHPSGLVKSEINYVNNLPRGAYKVYYINGKLEESGDWQGNKNVGIFKRYHENGKLAQDFTFTANGKRDGIQTYYYENGKVLMTVEIEDGVANGLLKVYYPNGEPKEEKRLVNGDVEEGSQKTYKTKNPGNITAKTPELPKQETIPNKTDKPNLEEFKQTGFNTLYNRNQQITQVGEFKEGRLWNGKWHRYDENGLLRKVEVFKEGRFIGYGILEDSNK